MMLLQRHNQKVTSARVPACATDLIQICDVLRTPGLFFGFDQCSAGQIVDREALAIIDHALTPVRRKSESRQRSEKVEENGRAADHVLKAGPSKVFGSDINQRHSELRERSHHARRIVLGRLQPKIEVLGETGLRVVHGSLATNHQVAHLVLSEEAKQVFEIGVHLGHPFSQSTSPERVPKPLAEWLHRLEAAKSVYSRCASHPGWNTSRHTNHPWRRCFC